MVQAVRRKNWPPGQEEGLKNGKEEMEEGILTEVAGEL